MTRRAFLFASAFFAAGVTLIGPSRASAQQKPGSVSGVVQSADGKPVPNARVFLQPGDGRAAVTTPTDDAGQYRFAKVKPGVYELRAQSGGAWTELERNVSVRRSEEVCVKLTLPEKAPLL